MKITDLNVDGFGLWHDLQLSELSDKLTVLYGPNEAGKTTLLQFVRSILYGFSAPRRHRYLPPLRGGRPGGELGIADGEGHYAVRRYDDAQDRSPQGRLTIVSDDGSGRRPQVLAAMLSGIDEATFNNVFAVSLRELQELATLKDSEAADLLYSLTAGLDRVPLIDKGEKVLDGTVSEVKAAHGKNTVVVAFDGDGSFLGSLPGVAKVSDFGQYVEIKMSDGADPQKLLSDVAARLRIRRFEIVEPSLHDIFVETVTGHGKEAA